MIRFQRRKKLVQVGNTKNCVGIPRRSVLCCGLWAAVGESGPVYRSRQETDNRAVTVKDIRCS